MTRTLLLSSAIALALSLPASAELYSTPQEKAQTRALNQSGVQGTYAQPQTLNGAQDTTTRPAEDLARGNLNPDDFVALTTVDPDRLDGASVEDSSGAVVGRVRSVMLGQNGTPSQIEIGLDDGRDVRVSESSLRYNPNDHVLLTRLDIGQLHSMAARDMGQ